MDLKETLSQRKGSSLFLTTMTNGSALQSARGENGLNLESTAELKAFATIDLTKINKDRTNQLKQALEDNLKEKEKELEQVTSTFE
jgi:hypothetical protein